MKEILITGCAGLLGNHLTRHLLKKGYKVIGLDNLFGSYKDLLPEDKNFTFHELDLADYQSLRKIFNGHNFSTVYHFAAYAAEGLSPFIRRFNYQNNVINSINIINECIERDIKIIFTSSMAVYGCSTPPFIEDLTPTPCDPYGIAKYTVELDLKTAGSQFDLRYSILRPHNVLGIYQNMWDNYRNVIGIFIRKALHGEALTVYGDGGQTRAFSDIKFYLDPFESLIDGHNGEIFNIGAEKVYTLNETAQVIQKIAATKGYPVDIIHTEERHEVKHAFSDHSKARKELNFKDETDLESLVVEIFDWALTQPDREIKKMDYEINKNMYSFWR